MAIAAQPLDANGVPVSSGYVPNLTPIAIQGSQRTKTDTITNTYTAPVFESRTVEDGRQGLAYIATTGKLATATNGNLIMGASLFNPSGPGKTIVVQSARVMQSSSSSTTQMNFTTADPALATVLSAINQLAGYVTTTSSASVTCSANNATASIATPGTLIDTAMLTALAVYEFIPPGQPLILPSGAANGIAVYTTVTTAGQFYAISFRWVEY